MRRIAFLAIAGITFVALFFAGFALFAPEPVDAPAPVAEVTVPSERGQAAGRLASLSFSAVAASVLPVPEVMTLDPAAFDTLFAASLSPDELATGPSSTTTEPPSTTSTSTSTSTSTTRPSTTTTRPPTTTTTSTTSTTTTSTTLPPTTTTSSTTTTTTTTPTTTTTIPYRLTSAQMQALAEEFFPGQVQKAMDVAWCESGWRPAVVSGNGLYVGLFQHAVAFWDLRSELAGWGGASITDPRANTAVAAWLVGVNGGWGAWPTCGL